MIEHDGKRIPVFNEAWDPSDKEHVWIDWEDLSYGAAIVESTWTLPNGWVGDQELVGQTVVDLKGNQYNLANGISLSTTLASGTYEFANKVVFPGPRQYERSVKLVIAEL